MRMRRQIICTAAALMLVMPEQGRAEPLDPLSVVFVQCTREGRTITGSGVVIDTEGRLLTSKHVVIDASASCTGAMGTQLDPTARKNLRVVEIAPDNDVAMLQFVEQALLTSTPVPYVGTDAIAEGLDVVAYGYHPTNEALPTASPGQVKSADRLTGGLIEVSSNTVRGMSGGPVVASGKLLGITAAESFDNLGQMIATRFVVADEFPATMLAHMSAQTPVDPADAEREVILTEQLASTDLCTQLLREQISERDELFPKAAEIANFGMDLRESDLAERAEFWVTVTTGPAKWLDCSSGNMLKSMFFPMGMMVRPERDVEIGGHVHTVFQTEHGLRVFLDVEGLRPIDEDIAYIFSNGDGAFKVCKQRDDKCDAYSEFRLTEHDRHWPFVSGYQSYLRAEGAAEIDLARAQLEALFEYQLDPPDPDDPLAVHLDLTNPDSNPSCVLREARLHTFFNHFDLDAPQKGSEYPQPVRFSLCSFIQGGVYNRYERLKLVTHTYAEERFRQLWAVITIPTLPANIEAATRALFKVDSPIVQIIKCGDPRGEVFTLGSISRKKVNSVTDVINNDQSRYSIFRQFQIAQAQSPVDIFKSAPLFNDIELTMLCDDENGVRNAGSLIIDLEPLTTGARLEIQLFDLYGALRDNFGNLGMVDDQLLNKRLRGGVMYRICDFHEYIVWRTILFNEIKDSDLVRQAKDILAVDLSLMADHITHLILASVFSTDVKLRNSENRRQGCV